MGNIRISRTVLYGAAGYIVPFQKQMEEIGIFGVFYNCHSWSVESHYHNSCGKNMRNKYSVLLQTLFDDTDNCRHRIRSGIADIQIQLIDEAACRVLYNCSYVYRWQLCIFPGLV